MTGTCYLMRQRNTWRESRREKWRRLLEVAAFAAALAAYLTALALVA